MASNKVAKKLPKRTGSAHKKAKRAESWARGKKRKEQRNKEQERRAAINREHRQRGELTPAEAAYRLRRQRRRALSLISKSGCVGKPTIPCQRPKSHKGKCGLPTKTEMAQAIASLSV